MRSYLAHLSEWGFGQMSTRPHRGGPCYLLPAPLANLVLAAALFPLTASAAEAPATLLADAVVLMETGACDGAVPLLEELVASHPRAREVPTALFDLGLCRERQGDLDSSLLAYGDVLHSHRRSTVFRDALFRRGLTHAALADPRRALADFSRLRRTGAARDQREKAVLRLQLGACHGALGRTARAARLVVQAQETLEQVDLHEDPDAAWYLAQAHVVLGDLLADGMERVSLDTVDGDQQRERLARRLELFSQARDHYLATQSYDSPLWICAAGARLGQLYERAREDLLAAPPPSLLTEEQAALYHAELVRRTAEYLEAAAEVYRETLRFAAMARVDNRWVEQARLRLDELDVEPLIQSNDL